MTIPFRFSCQTYSWQMSIDRYRGRVAHMTEVAGRAGFSGFEPELVMLGDDWSIDRLRDDLDAAGLTLAALVLAQDWRGDEETDAEKAAAGFAISAAAALGARLVLVPLPGADRSDLRRRQTAAIGRMGDVATRAADIGVASTFHPNSPAGSAFRTPDDYALMRELLPAHIGYTPDVGHIARGGMDPLSVIREWRERVDHVHIKDVAADGTWAETGRGVIDIPAVLDYLADTGYGGWVTFEDESPAAAADPDAATIGNGRWTAAWEAAR